MNAKKISRRESPAERQVSKVQVGKWRFQREKVTNLERERDGQTGNYRKPSEG